MPLLALIFGFASAVGAPLLAVTSGVAERAGGEVRVDTLWSQALGTRKALLVYLPPSYAAHRERRYPVAYYLHGLYGTETDWVRKGRIDVVMDSLVARGASEMILVMPDGDDGWYTTWNTLPDPAACRATTRAEPAETYCVPWPHYDDYVARDVVAHVDSVYRTLADRSHRGIAGLSMGGYGAVALALSYPEVFGAAASHSGVLSPSYAAPHPFDGHPRYAASTEELRALRGSTWALIARAFGTDTAGWRARDPGRIVAYARSARRPVPALFLDVGREDALADQNRDFHATLTRLEVVHRYAEWPGRHDWPYWRAHVTESLMWLAEQIARRGS